MPEYFESPYCRGCAPECTCPCHSKAPVFDSEDEMIPEADGGEQHRAQE